MQHEKVAISSLVFDPNNARKHNRKNIDAIKGSLTKFGQQRAIVVDNKNVVIAGNGTLEAARELGWEEIWIYRTPLAEEAATAFAIVDNRSAELGAWKNATLQHSLAALQETKFNPDSIGFDARDMKKIIQKGDIKKKLKKITPRYQIIVQCDNQEQQLALFDELSDAGFRCRVQ